MPIPAAAAFWKSGGVVLDMKRRRFLGISAATVAVAAIPVMSSDVEARWLTADDDAYAIRGDKRPKIGSKFYVWSEEAVYCAVLKRRRGR